jgi:hypothetical protein
MHFHYNTLLAKGIFLSKQHVDKSSLKESIENGNQMGCKDIGFKIVFSIETRKNFIHATYI